MIIITNIVQFESVYVQRITFKNVVGLAFSYILIFYRSYTNFYVISFLLQLLYVCIYRDYIYEGEEAKYDIAILSVTRGHVVNNSKLLAAFMQTYSSRYSKLRWNTLSYLVLTTKRIFNTSLFY
jgi:hypothetical protein